MKKRLLSAVLALAMVLTLLPMSAFAVDWVTPAGQNAPNAVGMTYQPNASSTPVPYYDDSNPKSIKTVTVTRCTASNEKTGQVYGKWYWQKNKGLDAQTPQYMEVTTGIVTGTSGSGQWYADVRDYTNDTANGDRVKGAFTVLGTGVDLDLNTYIDTSLNLVIANSVSTLTIPDTLTQLTISGKFQETATTPGVASRGLVNAITTTRSAYASTTKTGLTINASDIIFGNIHLSGRANTLRFTDNCAVNGTITMDGATYTSQSALAPNAWNAQTINATNSTFGDNITITGSTGGGVTMKDCTMSGGATKDTLSFTSDGGNIQIQGSSAMNTIVVQPRTKTGQYASVSITGGSVGGVTQVDCADGGNGNQIRITASGTNTKFGTITALNGAVNITDADGAAITVPKGTLTIGGSDVNVTGDLTLGATGATTLTINATGSSFGGVKAVANKGGNLTINGWVGKRLLEGGNYYGELDLKDYAGKKVTGGSFAGPVNTNMTQNLANPVCLKWLDTANLQFMVNSTAGNWDLYKKDELARAISDIGTTSALGDFHITVLGQGNTSTEGASVDLTLVNGQNPLAKIKYNSTTPLILPEKINNMNITTWFVATNRNTSFPSGTTANIPYVSGGLTLNCTATSTGVSKLTKASVTAVASSDTNPVVNQNVTVKLTGNTINVTGAVTPNAGGIATVLVDLETDAVDQSVDDDGNPIAGSGSYIVLEKVRLDYNVNTKQITFNPILPEDVLDKGALVQDGLLVLNNGTGEKYNVTASLTESASSLGIAPDSDVDHNIVVTFGGKLAGWSAGQKAALTETLLGNSDLDTTNAKFTYGANQAMQQAINAVQATITSDTTVKSWIKTAQTTVWRSGYKSPVVKNNTNMGYMPNLAPNTGNFDTAATDNTSVLQINNDFIKAYIVPYLVVNVTDYNESGTMTATLTPHYRVDVSAATYDDEVYFTVQQGRALKLDGEVATDVTGNQIKVKFHNLPSVFNTQKMHQDGKYVYTGTAASGWMISHVGANGGLGTVEINGKPGLVTIASPAPANAPAVIANRVPSIAVGLNCAYDTLQAAIDDTTRGITIQTSDDVLGFGTETMDTVVIDGQYTGSSVIDMSGVARKVYVIANGQQDVTANGKNVDVQTQGGFRYLVELKQDAVAAGTVAIAAQGVANVNISLSATRAKVGQTVTVTLTPVGGAAPTGVVVKTNTGATLPATPTGVTNQFSFVVPSGATSITVTPNFGQTVVNRNPVVTVTNAGSGSGTAVTSAGSNQVAPGTLVTVTTSPGANQRTMGVNVSGATATRTGANTFQFIVPSGVTNVTVTPRFDANNGTLFEDVWSTEYYSNPVRWAVERGITNGDGSEYRFGTGKTCTREDMVTFLWRAAGSPTVTGVTNPFWDVQPGTYYYNAVLWAVRNGITKGVSTNQFGVGQTVIRADAVTFLYRYAGSPNANASSGFGDVSSNEYYAKPVTWAVGKGITNGDGSTTVFNPGGACLREQIVTFLYRNATGNRA